MTATIIATPPEQSHPQHLRALARANAVRLARAELKRRISGGEVSAAEVLGEGPPEADGMTVADVLRSQRRWGEARCRRFLLSLQISETKTVGNLTARQREQIVGRLG